ncbi:MAG: PD40 domain-containing protein [Candidatus Eisenbacteria sp.]|nr:PD40 domain-containing protein [Candidatus Eisenbacteria bacterium]
MKISSFSICVLLISLATCTDDSTKPATDSTPPAAIDDLAIQDSTGNAVTLTWTAPGDDGTEDQAARYDLRCSMSLLTEEGWDTATVADSSLVPRAAGLVETLTVVDLNDGTWYFGLKAADEVPNWSAISNVVSTTLLDTIPPDQVTDLAVVSVTASSVGLSWTTPGDDGQIGVASEYDFRYALVPITEETWDSALRVQDVPVPSPAGTAEFSTVTGLEQDTGYFFALKTIDNADNESTLSNVLSHSTASLEQLTFSPACESPACRTVLEADWSPDGLTIAFSAPWEEGFVHGELYLISVDGGSAVRLTDEPDYARFPSWSPDGTQLVFVSPRAINIDTIWIMDAVSGGSSTAVVSGSSSETLAGCVWSPDGSRIAYSVTAWFAQTIVACDIYTIDLQGGNPNLVLHDTEWIIGLDWSPDGSQIVFSSARRGNYDIWVVPATGGTPVRLTSDPADDSSPVWSPDGNRIAFASLRTGNSEIWLMSSTGEDPTQLTFGPGSEDGPSWSPDGKGIAFRSLQDYIGDIWLLRWD